MITKISSIAAKLAFGLGIAALLHLSMADNARAAVEQPGEVSAAVVANVTFDNNTGLFTYRYTLTNYAESNKPLDSFYIPLRGATALNLLAPPGWEANLNDSGTMIGWCACKEEGFVPPPNYVDDGNLIPSKFAVPPGESRQGFSFQSPYPPADGIYYLGGFVRIPVEGVDFPVGQEPLTPSFPGNMKSGTVAGPIKSDSLYTGGRRPAVDGFLVFANLREAGLYTRPLIVDIVFGANGETVRLSTFSAVLNGVDVTSRFRDVDQNRRRAVFESVPGSPLLPGKNVLSTRVEGVVPGASRKAIDSDRVTFLVQ